MPSGHSTMTLPQHIFPLILADYTSPYSVRRLVVQYVVYQTKIPTADSQPLPFRLRQFFRRKPVAEKINHLRQPFIRVIRRPGFWCHCHDSGIGEVVGDARRCFTRFQQGQIIRNRVLSTGSMTISNSYSYNRRVHRANFLVNDALDTR
jgi:hypothetical protein